MAGAEQHEAVGAYALGVLEPYDALCCERHIACCGPCALRLAEFTEVTAALAQLADRAPLTPPPSHRGPRGGRRASRHGGCRVRSWLVSLRP